MICKSQTVIKNLNNQVFYLGIENPVHIITDSDTICGGKIHYSESVEIKKDSNNCIYYITPKSKIKPAIIYVKNHKIDFTNNIQLTPDPVWMRNIQNGYLSRKIIDKDAGLIMHQPYFNYDTRYSVESIFIRVMRNNKLVYTETAKRGRFSQNFKEALKKDDIVVFTNILINAPEGKRILDEISFKIKN